MEEYKWNSESSAVKVSPIEKATEQTKRMQVKASGVLRGSAYVICVVAVILLEILRRFVTGALNTEFAWEYVFAALISSMTSLLAFYIFFPYGKRECRSKTMYLNAYRLLQRAIGAIGQHALRDKFRAYCRDKPREEARETKEDRLLTLEDLGVPRKCFENKWRHASKKELKAAVKGGTLTGEAKKQILLCRKSIEVLPYSPLYFLAGAGEKKQDAYLRNGSHHEMWALIKKPLSVVTIAVAQSAFTIGVTEAQSGIEVFLAIVMSVFQICLSAFTGYLGGYGVAEKDAEINLAKAGFMLDFLEAQGVRLDAENIKEQKTAPQYG